MIASYYNFIYNQKKKERIQLYNLKNTKLISFLYC